MATDLERLVVSLEARLTQYERTMNRAIGVTNRSMRQIETRTTRAGNSIGQNLSGGLVAFQRGVAGAFAGAVALRGAQQLIDASTRIENSLRVAGLEGAALEGVYNDLFAAAQRNAAPIESLVQLYSRASIVQNELGVSTEELTRFTENVAVALRVAGTDAASASGALLQLSQALGSGVVRAEEFNSIQEGALPVLQAVAAGLEEAGGSVSRLRQLVVEGRVSSEAFFRAFEVGSVVLEERVANAELTISQQFVRLQNVLIDTAGRFDEAAGASASAGQALEAIALTIQQVGDFFEQNAGAIRAFTSALEFETYKEAIADLRRELGIADVVDPFIQSIQIVQGGVENLRVSFQDLADTTVLPPVLREQLASIEDQLNNNITTTEDAIRALNELGAVNPSFGDLFSGLATAIGYLRAATQEAQNFRAALPGTPGQRGRPGRQPAGSTPATPPPAEVTPISLDQYPILAAPAAGGGGTAGGGGGGGGGGGQSPLQQYQEALDAQQRRIDLLNQETEVTRQFGAAGGAAAFELERLRVQQELINAATEAGLALSPAQLAAIDQLATATAQATVEAEMLAEAQDNARESMDEWLGQARDTMQGFIQDLIDGTSAADALSNALAGIGSALINMGLGGLFGQGGGDYGLLGQLFGFAKGGVAAHGRPKAFASGGVARSASIFGEAGPEAAVPLPDGRRIPVDLRMPSLGSASSANAFTYAPQIDARGADADAVARLERVMAKDRAEFDSRVKLIVQRRGKDIW